MPSYNQYPNGFWNVGGQYPNYSYQPTPVAPIQPQPVATPNTTFNWIQGGEVAATAYQVAPGNTVVLMDTENPVLYMKSTDVNGRPQPMQIRYLVTKEEYEKIQNGGDFPNTQNFVTKEDLENFMIEADKKYVIKKEARNGKSSV